MSEEEKKAIEDLKEEIKGAEYEGHGKDRIIIELKTILNLIEKQEDKIKLLENEELSYIAGYEDGKHHKMTATAIQVENQREYLINEQIKVYKERIENQQKELNNLKEIEKSHKEENGKLRVALEKEKEKNKELEKQINLNKKTVEIAQTQILEYSQGYKDGLNKETTATAIVARELELNFIRQEIKHKYISKDKIKEKMGEIMNYTYMSSEERQQQNYAYDRLKELLEEK